MSAARPGGAPATGVGTDPAADTDSDLGRKSEAGVGVGADPEAHVGADVGTEPEARVSVERSTPVDADMDISTPEPLGPVTSSKRRDPLKHSVVEDVAGVLTGTFVASLGVFLLKSTGAVTGGTAGLALLLSYALALPFGVVFFALNVPFFALALWKKGLSFTIRTAMSVSLLSVFSLINPLAVAFDHLDPVFSVIAGNLLAGIGLLVLFRHRSSLGGFNIVALLVQEKLGWRAGYVQMGLDVAVVVCSLTVVPPLTVALSAGGAVILNLVLALNHRPGRYAGI